MSFALNRRHLLGFATAAAVQMGLGPIHAARGATASPLPAIKPGSHTSLGPLKSIDAGLVRVGYAELGPANGPVVILLHGWPYDIHSYADVAPLLADAGYRVIVPYLRGYGTTHFIANDTLRNGQQADNAPQAHPCAKSHRELLGRTAAASPGGPGMISGSQRRRANLAFEALARSRSSERRREIRT